MGAPPNYNAIPCNEPCTEELSRRFGETSLSEFSASRYERHLGLGQIYTKSAANSCVATLRKQLRWDTRTVLILTLLLATVY